MAILARRDDPVIIERTVYLTAALLALPILMALAVGRDYIIMTYVAAVAGSFLIAFPRACLYLFIVSVSFFYPYFIGRVGIHPFDICMFLLAASLVLQFLLRGGTRIVATRIDRYFLFLIFATLISAVFAYDISYSIFPCLRIIVVFLAFRIVYGFALEMGVRKLVNFYIYHVFALSVLNLILFIRAAGQDRIFGPAWLAFETYSMTALPMAIAFLLWADNKRERLKFGLISLVIGLALLATQSRAPLLAVLLAIPVLLMAVYLRSSGEARATFFRRVRKAIIPVSIVLITALLLRQTFFEGFFVRVASFIDSLQNPAETVYLRLILWTAAWKAFIANPITGVGIGNFKIVGDIVTEMKFYAEWYYISGMSAHNVILHYLAETGIIGATAIAALAGVNLKIAYRSLKLSVSPSEQQMSAATFISIFIFCVTIFYMRAWTWGQGGYIMALLFAFSVAWNYHLEGQRLAER